MPSCDAKAHDLKTWPEFFEAIRQGTKRYELRNNDREFATGDILILREFSLEGSYTGEVIVAEVLYISTGNPWLHSSYCCMSIEILGIS